MRGHLAYRNPLGAQQSGTRDRTGHDKIVRDLQHLGIRIPKGGGTYEVDLPPGAFNTGMPPYVVPGPELDAVEAIEDKMQVIGFWLARLGKEADALAESGSTASAKRCLRKLHDAACILFLHWSYSHKAMDRTEEHAAAMLFNRVTMAARKLDGKFGLFDKSHIRALKSKIAAEMRLELDIRGGSRKFSYDPAHLAGAIETAARERTHEKSWAWVVLPTFERQHYGRILLDVVEVEGTPYRTYIVQPTFSDGEATLFHTHGQNWGFSRPLGRGGENIHLNTRWLPASRSSIFPLRQMPSRLNGKVNYCSDDIVVIPPRTIHGIAGNRKGTCGAALDEIMRMKPAERRSTLSKARFGEVSCLHVYRPELPLADDFIYHPFDVSGNGMENDFFDKNDMIVFDHRAKEVWSGMGGAWELRMLKYGPSGDHCGLCFREKDPRRRNIPEGLVLKRFLEENPPDLVRYKGAELLDMGA